MKRTLITLATAVAVTTTSITATPAATTTPESSVSEQTSSAAETTAPAQPTAEPKNKSSISSSDSKGSGWSPTGSTPIDLVLLIAGALGISFLVQPLLNGNLDQVINDLKKQFNLPM
jgi:hypothetical protein